MKFVYALLGGVLLGVLPLIKLWMIYPISLDSKNIHAQLVDVLVRSETREIFDTGVHAVSADCAEFELVFRVSFDGGTRTSLASYSDGVCGVDWRDQLNGISGLVNMNMSGYWSESNREFTPTKFRSNRVTHLVGLAVGLFFVGCFIGSRVRCRNW